MGHRDEVLIAPPAQVRFLFPERVLADAPRADALSDQQIDDATAGGVQVVVDAPRALRGDALQTPARTHGPQ